MATETLSLEELTDRLNQELDAKGLERVQPRTMYRYVEKGLVPSGGRGPGARYAESTIPTLVFVKMAQAKTKLSLDEIAKIVRRVPPGVIEAVASGREPLEVVWVGESFTPSRVGALARRFTSARRDPEETNRVEGFAGGRYGRLSFLGESQDRPATPEATLGQLADPSRAIAPDREGQWTWLEVTKNFAIGARGLTEHEAPRLKAIADWLRESMR